MRLTVADRTIERTVDVGRLTVEALEPLPLAVAAQVRPGPLSQGGVKLAVPALDPLKLPASRSRSTPYAATDSSNR